MKPYGIKHTILVALVAGLSLSSGMYIGEHYSNQKIISEEVARCEASNGEFRMWWSEYGNEYRIVCEVPQKYLFNYSGNL